MIMMHIALDLRYGTTHLILPKTDLSVSILAARMGTREALGMVAPSI